MNKSLTAITPECRRQCWTSTPQSSSCAVTYHSSRKLFKLDKPNIRDTAWEIGTNSWETYSCGPLHMDEQRQDDQQEPIYNNSVPIQDVALKTSRGWWTIETSGGKGSERSVLAARHDDDDDEACKSIRST